MALTINKLVFMTDNEFHIYLKTVPNTAENELYHVYFKELRERFKVLRGIKFEKSANDTP